MPYILKTGGALKEYRKNYARLIKKIYACPPVFAVEGGSTNMPEVPGEDAYNRVYSGHPAAPIRLKSRVTRGR